MRKYFYWKDGSYIMEIGGFLDYLFSNKKKDSSLQKIEKLKDLYI